MDESKARSSFFQVDLHPGAYWTVLGNLVLLYAYLVASAETGAAGTRALLFPSMLTIFMLMYGATRSAKRVGTLGWIGIFAFTLMAWVGAIFDIARQSN